MVVEPGAVATEIWGKGVAHVDRAAARMTPAQHQRYDTLVAAANKQSRQFESDGVAPAAVADAIDAKRPRTRTPSAATPRSRHGSPAGSRIAPSTDSKSDESRYGGGLKAARRPETWNCSPLLERGGRAPPATPPLVRPLAAGQVRGRHERVLQNADAEPLRERPYTGRPPACHAGGRRFKSGRSRSASPRFGRGIAASLTQ